MKIALSGAALLTAAAVLEAVRAVASGEHVPLALRHGNADFMIQRGGGCSL